MLLADVYRRDRLAVAERLSPESLVHVLQQQDVRAWFHPTTEAIVAHLCREAQPSDVILIMSNGGFENIHQRLLTALQHGRATDTPTARLANRQAP